MSTVPMIKGAVPSFKIQKVLVTLSTFTWCVPNSVPSSAFGEVTPLGIRISFPLTTAFGTVILIFPQLAPSSKDTP